MAKHFGSKRHYDDWEMLEITSTTKGKRKSRELKVKRNFTVTEDNPTKCRSEGDTFVSMDSLTSKDATDGKLNQSLATFDRKTQLGGLPAMYQVS